MWVLEYGDYEGAESIEDFSSSWCGLIVVP